MTGQKSRDLGLGLGRNLLGRLGLGPSHWEKYSWDSPGTQIPETLRTGTKIVGTVPGFLAMGLGSQRRKSFGLDVPSHGHPCFFLNHEDIFAIKYNDLCSSILGV